jgi:hypothetical protein
MTRNKSRLVFSLATAVCFLAAIAGQPFLSTSATAQVASDQLGTTSARAADQEITRDKGEALEKDTIEADPTAPDDSVDSTSVSASPGPVAIKVHPIPIPLPGGLDFLAAGVGTRNTGSGTIDFQGAPPGAVPVRATITWSTIRDGFAIPLNEIATFNGVNVVGNLIGVTAQPCWAGNFLAAYQASVIALLVPGINGQYRVSNLPSSITTGRDPWLNAPVPAPRPLSEGVSLVVIYSHASVPLTARVFTHTVVQMFFGTLTVNHGLGLPIPPYTTMKHCRLGADGQIGSSTTPLLFATNERTFIGPNALVLTQIKGPGSPFNGDSDYNGNDAHPLNQLHDTNVSSSGPIVPAGSVAYTVRYISNGDCIVPLLHVLGTK